MCSIWKNAFKANKYMYVIVEWTKMKFIHEANMIFKLAMKSIFTVIIYFANVLVSIYSNDEIKMYSETSRKQKIKKRKG